MPDANFLLFRQVKFISCWMLSISDIVTHIFVFTLASQFGFQFILQIAKDLLVLVMYSELVLCMLHVSVLKT
jgi:hypothetical protein